MKKYKRNSEHGDLNHMKFLAGFLSSGFWPLVVAVTSDISESNAGRGLDSLLQAHETRWPVGASRRQEAEANGGRGKLDYE